ncbi:MAG: MGMT family protein [Pyramidobacter sp.]|nr:MGMT family protein [Pyramidobacter sp.]
MTRYADEPLQWRLNGTLKGAKKPPEKKKIEAQTSFFERVYAVVRRIPRGKVATYGQIAVMLGAPRCARQVGWAMRSCPDYLPWQRVVKSDGTIAGGGYASERRERLEREGVPFSHENTVNLALCRWDGQS